MLYEIINMSDPYTIEAKSLDVAFIACMFGYSEDSVESDNL